MKYQVDLPYPTVHITKPNDEYGQMILDNIGGMVSKMSAVSLYMYNYTIAGEAFKELKEIFLQISIVEMKHLDIFSSLALQLGMDPRLWSGSKDHNEYWSPSYNNYPNQLKALLVNVITSEQKAIDKYSFQASIIKDPVIVDILQRIIQDDKMHVEILEGYYKKLVRK